MAFTPEPTAVFAGWSENGTDITVPIASFPELTAAEADAVTGDSRAVIHAMLERIWAWYSALPLIDRPLQLRVRRTGAINTNTGGFTKRFIVAFDLDDAAPNAINLDPE